MRQVFLRPMPPNATDSQKLDWCIQMISEIARASQDADPNKYADGYTITNLTETRTLDANAGTLADLAAAQAAIDATRDVLLTFIQDHKKRGSKRA